MTTATAMERSGRVFEFVLDPLEGGPLVCIGEFGKFGNPARGPFGIDFSKVVEGDRRGDHFLRIRGEMVHQPGVGFRGVNPSQQEESGFA